MKRTQNILLAIALAGITSCTGMKVVTPEGGEVALVGVGSRQNVAAMSNGSFSMEGYEGDSEKGFKNLIWAAASAYGVGKIAGVASDAIAAKTARDAASQATAQAGIAAETQQLQIVTDGQIGLAELEAVAP